MIKRLYELACHLGFGDSDDFPLNPLFARYWRLYYLYTLGLGVSTLLNGNGYNLMEDTWDYCIVLDACRYDIFREAQEQVDVECDALGMKRSPASATMEWVRRCLTKKYNDTVLVTANPQLSKTKLRENTGNSERFYKNIPAWDTGWNDNLKVTPPWTMVELCRKAVKKYPDKRLLFWFMQPHYPFIPFVERGDYSMGYETVPAFFNKKSHTKKIWHDVLDGTISIDTARLEYLKNARLALKCVDNLLEYLEGDIIVTSDHGNAIGELGLYGHPQRVHIPPLVNIPFMEVTR